MSDDNSFTWDMDSSIIALNPSLLTSTRKDQNSLNFQTGKSVYDINSYTITANNVPWLDVADMRMFPGTEQIIIHSNAVLDSISCSRIVSSNNDTGHEFINSRVLIRGKNNYTGTGDYIYHNIAGQELLLPFAEIGAKPGKPSEGKAKVDTISPFFLSPEFKFIGDVEWTNNNKLLNFKGSYSLTQDCPRLKNYWVRLNTEIDPTDLRIPVDSLSRSYDGEVLRQGFFLSNQPISLYSAFLGPHLSYTDHPVISTFGHIRFDYTSDQYIIQQAQLTDSLPNGPTLTFDRNTCTTSARGEMDLGVNLEPLQISTTGTIQHNFANDSILSDQIMVVDFFLDDKLLDIFAEKLNDKTSLMPVDYTRENYKTSVLDWLGKDKGQELLDELSLMGGFRKVPDEFRHTLFFTDLKMKWNSERGSYQSVGKIGIGNIDNKSVNKLVDGHLEIVKSRGGDSFTFYVAFDTNSYFFFYYNRGVMQVLAGPSFEEFNNRLRDIKPRKRRLKTKSGPRYEYALGQYGLVRNFLNAINDN